MAAPKDSKFALELIRGLSEIKEPGDPWLTTGNKYMGEMVKKTACNVKIYPSYYFLPEHFDPAAEKYTGTDKIYSRHQWGTTLDKYNEGV